MQFASALMILLICVLLFPSDVLAAGGASFSTVYTSGDVIMEHPIEACTIMLFVIGISAALEYLLDTAGEVENKYFRVMFDALSEEITVVGLLSLMLSFSESILAFLPKRWISIFNWAHMCLFFMALSLICIVGFLLGAVISNGKRWTEFESARMEAANGRKNYFSGKEALFYLASGKFFECVSLAGYTEEQKRLLMFSEYLQKAERACLVELTDLSWKTWMALTTMIIINALRTKFIPVTIYNDAGEVDLDQKDRLINLATFIICCGYGPLIVFIMIRNRLNVRLEQYLSYDPLQSGAPPTNLRELYDPKAFLFWQSTEGTLTVLQIFIMFFEWYVSVFSLSMLYDSMTKLEVWYRLTIIAAYAPPVFFLGLMPWMLTVVAMLSHLGSSLDRDLVEKLLDSSKEYDDSGKHGDYVNEDHKAESEMDAVEFHIPGQEHHGHGGDHGGHGHGDHHGGHHGGSHHGKKFVSKDIDIDDSVMYRFAKGVQQKKHMHDRKRERLEGKLRPAALMSDSHPSGYFSDEPTDGMFERGGVSNDYLPSPGPRHLYQPPSVPM
eukprot:PhF_6_TR15654/c0_g1_i2/m.24329